MGTFLGISALSQRIQQEWGLERFFSSFNCTDLFRGLMHTIVHVWGSDSNLQELVLTFHYVGPGDGIWVGSKHLYPRGILPTLS